MVGLGARTALGRILGPHLLELLELLRVSGHHLGGAVPAPTAPPSLLQVLEAVQGIAEAPRLHFELGVDHVLVRRQEDDQLSTCPAHEATRSEQGRKGAQLVGGVRTELPLRDGSNSATNTEQAVLDELGLHELLELGGHLAEDGAAVQRTPRRRVHHVQVVAERLLAVRLGLGPRRSERDLAGRGAQNDRRRPLAPRPLVLLDHDAAVVLLVEGLNVAHLVGEHLVLVLGLAMGPGDVVVQGVGLGAVGRGDANLRATGETRVGVSAGGGLGCERRAARRMQREPLTQAPPLSSHALPYPRLHHQQVP